MQNIVVKSFWTIESLTGGTLLSSSLKKWANASINKIQLIHEGIPLAFLEDEHDAWHIVIMDARSLKAQHLMALVSWVSMYLVAQNTAK
jgi:hypothetical protein